MDWFDSDFLADSGLNSGVKDSLQRQVAEVQKLIEEQKEADSKAELDSRSRFDAARAAHLLKVMRLKQRLARRQGALRDQKRVWACELAFLQSHLEQISLRRTSHRKAVVALLSELQRLLVTRPLVLRNLGRQSPLVLRVLPFLAEESTDNLQLEESQKTVEQLHNAPDFAPGKVLRQSKSREEKSTERSYQHLAELESKVDRLHRAISQRLSSLQSSDEHFVDSIPCFPEESPSLLTRLEHEERTEGEEDPRRLAFTPVCVPESPDLSAVENVPEVMDDWTGSFLNESVPNPAGKGSEKDAFPSRSKPCDHARIEKHSGDDEDLSLSNISVHALTPSEQGDAQPGATVSPSSRRVWKCLFCRCFRTAAVDAE